MTKIQENAKAFLSVLEVMDERETYQRVRFALGAISVNNPIYLKISDVMDSVPCDTDTAFNAVHRALSLVANGEAVSEESMIEYADGDTEIYNTNLAEWLAKSLKNGEAVDEAVEDMCAGDDGIYEQLRKAYFWVLEGLYLETLKACEEGVTK